MNDVPNNLVGGRRTKPTYPEASPFFSIVTVAKNAKDPLAATMKSVLAQSSRQFEYIVIDGGSNDGTSEFLKSRDHEIDYWTSEPDEGISEAFNKGIRIARGEIIGLLNAGDWYEENTLAAVFEAAQSNPDADVFSGSIEFWEHEKPVLFCHSNPLAIERETSIYHPTVFVKKAAYQKYGMYDPALKFAMDYELLLRFSRKGAKFYNIRQRLANMELDGISRANWFAALREVARARSAYFSALNTGYYHTSAIFKNLIAEGLRRIRLGSIYRFYWDRRNNRIAR